MKKDINVNRKSKSMVPALIIESRITNLSVVYMDVLNILFAEIGKDTDEDETLFYSIAASTYQKLKNISDIRDAYKTLKGKVWGNGKEGQGMDSIYIETIAKDKKRGERLRPIYRVGYDEGACSLTLAPEFKAMLVEVKKQDGGKIFASLQYTLPMKSVYSKKVYMMCKRFENSGVRFTEKYDWDMFREKIGVPDSYSDNMVEKRVLEQAEKEINLFSDIMIKYELVYKNSFSKRKTPIGIMFTIAVKGKAQLDELEKEEEQLPGQTSIYDFPEFLPESSTKNDEDTKKKIQKLLPNMTAVDISTVLDFGKGRSWDEKQIISLAEYTGKHTTDNATGYMIRIMMNKTGVEFEQICKTYQKNSFNNFEQHDYDFEALEKAMLAKI